MAFRSIILLLCLAAAAAQAEQKEFGAYVVHYSAVNSTFLTPDIAQRYGIVRGARNGFLNIAVQEKPAAGAPGAVTAVISGTKWNLLQESQAIDFVEVREGEAIYYIGQFEFSNAEPVRFELQIQPEGEGPSYPLEWDTRLYIN